MTLVQIVEKLSSVNWVLVDGADAKTVKECLARFPLDESASKRELMAALTEGRQVVTTREAEVAALRAQQATLKAEVPAAKAENSPLKSAVADLGREVVARTSEISTLKAENARLKAEVDAFRAARPGSVQAAARPVAAKPAARRAGAKRLGDRARSRRSCSARSAGVRATARPAVVRTTGEVVWTTGKRRVIAEFNGEWTAAVSRAQLGDAWRVQSVVFPSGVTAIGEKALYRFEVPESVAFPAGCIRFGFEAFAHCKSQDGVAPRRVHGDRSYR
jgi:cell division protein FtsB